MKINIFFIVLGILFFLSACEKSKLMDFELPPSVYFYKYSYNTNKDSMTYSFAIKEESVQSDTVFIPIRIMGEAAEMDREVNYEIMKNSDFIAENVQLLPAIVKAGGFTGNIPFKVLKTDELKNREMRIWIKIIDSKDFKAGSSDQLTYLIKLNNFLSKPSSWSDYWFGEYSQSKYGLIIRETGYTDFSGIGSASEYRYIVQKCENAILNNPGEYGDIKFP